VTLRATRIVISSVCALCIVGGVVGSLARADGQEQYPYDPACPWGRLADGHGMLLRCLKPAEASQLLAADVSAPVADATPGKTPPAASAATPAASSAPVLAKAGLVMRMGAAQADAGELPLAAKKLTAAEDKIIGCVEANGGVTSEPARVVLRFLVRERGRAEGVTVKSQAGMSKKAAECIAGVIDRRYVGYPAAPIVGATLPIELSTRR
jgi:hypothetical protein